MIEIIAHIDGCSGAGKTTLLNQIKNKYTSFKVIDLDDLFNESCKHLEIISEKHLNKKQVSLIIEYVTYYINNFIKKNRYVIIIGNHVFHNNCSPLENTDNLVFLNINTKNKFLLKTSPLISSYRAIVRDKLPIMKFSRFFSNNLIYYNYLKNIGYIEKSLQEILDFFNLFEYGQT